MCSTIRASLRGIESDAPSEIMPMSWLEYYNTTLHAPRHASSGGTANEQTIPPRPPCYIPRASSIVSTSMIRAAIAPPSTGIVTPVIHDESSEARKSTAPA